MSIHENQRAAAPVTYCGFGFRKNITTQKKHFSNEANFFFLCTKSALKGKKLGNQTGISVNI